MRSGRAPAVMLHLARQFIVTQCIRLRSSSDLDAFGLNAWTAVEQFLTMRLRVQAGRPKPLLSHRDPDSGLRKGVHLPFKHLQIFQNPWSVRAALRTPCFFEVLRVLFRP